MSHAARRALSVTTLMWKSAVMVGERSMKSTLSSASQWNDFRNSSTVNRATNLGEKSSLRGEENTLQLQRRKRRFLELT